MNNPEQQNNDTEQERTFWPMFDPISNEKLEQMRQQLSDATGLDFEDIPVEIAHPGEPRFDIFEAQTKLYEQSRNWGHCVEILRKGGYNFNPDEPGAPALVRRIAENEGVDLDDSFSGFVYNIGGNRIMYVSIREDRVVEIAQKYAAKEGEAEQEFKNLDDAKKYLQELAEKYFYHEFGHTVYLNFLDAETKNVWDSLVKNNQDLVRKVIEVQKDKHPNIESIPIGNEAFADVFAKILTGQKSRLGDNAEAETFVKKLLALG